MEFRLKYIFEFDFIAYFMMLIGCVVFFIWLFIAIKYIATGFRSPVILICCAVIPVWIYFCANNFIQEISIRTRFDADFILEVVSSVMMIDMFMWFVYKFIGAYSNKNRYKVLDADNPKKIKKNIEDILQEINFKQNAEMEKLYGILQVSALSIKKQKKMIRSGFLKNLIVSVIFFLLGLLIPECIRYILYSL